MKIVRKIFKYLLYLLLIPAIYFFVAMILSSITVDREETKESPDKTIYLTTNGVHLDIVLPKRNIDSLLLSGLVHKPEEKYLAFGWGDQDFYINTRTWADLKLETAFKAVFFKGPSLVHVTRFKNRYRSWTEIQVTESELKKLNAYLYNAFLLNADGEKVLLENQGYTSFDNFYKAKGSFSFYKTCNSWVNIGFKKSGLTACLWTPFDFGLLNKYE